MNTRPKTIICDIDGVLLKHMGEISYQHLGKPKVLKGVLEAFAEWDRKGYYIILMTGRRESTRTYTEKQLAECGIFYDYLIMGISGGIRVLINDCKSKSREKQAVAVNLKRNAGIKSLENL